MQNLEQKNGGTVFDGLFTQTNTSEPNSSKTDNTITKDSCTFESVESNPKESTELGGGAQNIARKSEPLQPDLMIESRVHEFDALVKQDLGDPAIQASTAPALSAAMGSESNLPFGGFTAFGESLSHHKV